MNLEQIFLPGFSTKINFETGEEFMGMFALSEDFMIITLNEDGSAVCYSSAFKEEQTSGTWTKKDGDIIGLTIDGETSTCICDGKTLTITQDEGIFILEKK